MGCRHSAAAAVVEVQCPSSATTPRTWASVAGDGTFTVRFEKKQGDKLGLGIGSTGCGNAVIFNIKPGGLLERHNQHAPAERMLFAGCVILGVNQRSGYWNIFEELTKPGPFEIRFSQKPPHGSNQNWFKEIESFGKDMEARGSSFMLRLSAEERVDPASAYSSVPTVRADAAGVDQCAICLQDVPGDVKLMQLPCGHCFHMLCAGRWLTQNGGRYAKRLRCPLCCQSVVGGSCRGCDEDLTGDAVPEASTNLDLERTTTSGESTTTSN